LIFLFFPGASACRLVLLSTFYGAGYQQILVVLYCIVFHEEMKFQIFKFQIQVLVNNVAVVATIVSHIYDSEKSRLSHHIAFQRSFWFSVLTHRTHSQVYRGTR